MPSFDIVCEINQHELQNAIDQSKREIANRFDFKGTKASIEQAEQGIVLLGESMNQLNSMAEILRAKMTRRGLDAKSLDYGEPEHASGDCLRQTLSIKQGIDQTLGKSIVKAIKQAKLKVQVSIQGDQLRVSGKKRDDLQQAIALVKGMDCDRPLQYVNFRD